jgi:prepilin peptidase CpaA
MTVDPVHLLGAALFAAAMARAACTDLRTRRIENGLVAALALGYLALAPLAGHGAGEVALNAAVAAAVLAGGVAAFALGWLGGGDGKLAAATALWLGPVGTFDYIATTALIGGALALGVLAFRAAPLGRAAASTRWIRRLHAPGTGIPYGVALAAAGLLTLQRGPWLGGGG